MNIRLLQAAAGRLGSIQALAGFAVALAVVASPFHSTLYPYTITRPTGFMHSVVRDSLGNNLDFFFVPPPPGSFTTGATIYAVPGHTTPKETLYLRSIGGWNVHRVEYIRLSKLRVSLVRGDFAGLAGHFTIERAGFVACARVWHITLSYATDRPDSRVALLSMLKSFRLTCASRAHR